MELFFRNNLLAQNIKRAATQTVKLPYAKNHTSILLHKNFIAT